VEQDLRPVFAAPGAFFESAAIHKGIVASADQPCIIYNMVIFKPALPKILLGLALTGITWQLGIVAQFFAAGGGPGSLAEYLTVLLTPASCFTFSGTFNGVDERVGNIIYRFFVVSQFLYGYILACLVLYAVKKVFGRR
jgi:hypothetical protein